MEVVVDRGKDGDIDSWKEVQLIYNSALKQISTKLEILNDEFQHVHRYNPIEHIKWRIKTPESIVKKLKKKKTYSFRVRAYKLGNNVKVYGSWSKVKKVKIKK